MHSPFVFDLTTNILPSAPCQTQPMADSMRRELLLEELQILIEDHGAGYDGHTKSSHRKSIREILRSSARDQKTGALLHRLVKAYQPAQMLELGTNLGFSALYQADANPQGKLISVEGAVQLAVLASKGLKMRTPNAEIHCGTFENVLHSQIDWNQFKPGHVLIDGNHRKEPTLAYFHFLLPKVKDGALMVFDDIHWSPGMTEAWESLIQHPEVSVSVDLFSLGLVWIRKNQAKEHFVLRF